VRESTAVRAAIALGLGQAIARGAVALYSLALVREFSPSVYGDFAYALAMLAILTALADGGFSRLLIRDAARVSASDRARVIPPLLVVRTIWSAAVVLAAAGASAGGAVTFSAGFTIVLLLSLMFEATAVGFEAAGIGTETPWRVAVGQLLGGTVLLGFVGVLLVTRPTPTAALAALACAAAVKLVWQLWAWRGELAFAARVVAWVQIRHWVRQAIPYLVIIALGTIYYRIDIVILHARRGAAETAPYAAAYRLVDVVLVVGGVIAAAVSPHLSRIHHLEPGRVWGEWSRYVTRTAMVAVPGAFCVAIAAYPLARFLFGQDYADSAGEALRLLTPGIAFMLLQIINAAVLFTSDDQRFLLRMSLPHVLMNIGLTWWLVGLAGSAGAATATSISEAVTFFYFAAVIRWRLRQRHVR
jgi:O-antigen/teichoic acid export membrane protein